MRFLLKILVLCIVPTLAHAQAPAPPASHPPSLLGVAEYRAQLSRELAAVDAQLATYPTLEAPAALLATGGAEVLFTALSWLYLTVHQDPPRALYIDLALGGGAALMLGGAAWMVARSARRDVPMRRALHVRRSQLRRELRAVDLSLSVMPSGGLSVTGRF